MYLCVYAKDFLFQSYLEHTIPSLRVKNYYLQCLACINVARQAVYKHYQPPYNNWLSDHII